MSEAGSGLALRCDTQGNILEVLRNSPPLGISIKTGMPFARLAAAGSLAKALTFLTEVKTAGAAFDWEIHLAAGERTALLHFSGGLAGDGVLLAGAQTGADSRKLCEELIPVHNGQSDGLRAGRKDDAVAASLYEEISRLNNEQAGLQRELARKNAELERLYAQAQRAAITDPLTGIYNRRGFFELSERELQRANRFGHPLSAVMFDIDHFKRLNDAHGHAAGDQALKETAERCFRALRKVDILGRYGGEEFAALLPETDLESACQAAERLRIAATPPIQTGGAEIHLTVSLGVAVRNRDDDTLDILLRRADQALYEAKSAGRNCVRADRGASS